MKRLAFILFALICTQSAYGQAWSGIIDPSRAIDWSNVGVSGGIPARTTICATLNPGATNAQVNAAIQNCPSGQTVFLNAGNYNWSGTPIPGSNPVTYDQIRFKGKSGVTLRGAGANATFITVSVGGNCHGYQANICVDAGDDSIYVGAPQNQANWTAGYTKGTTSITLSSFANLHVGAPLILDQADDAADTGNKYVCSSNTTSPPCSLEDNINNGQRPHRNQFQIVQVVSCGTSTPGAACSSGSITITPGLYALNWSGGKAPGAWWVSLPAQGVGIENLSIDNSGGDSNGIEFLGCQDCWAKGVRSINSTRSHIEVRNSNRVTVRDNYMYLTKNAATQSYGVSPYGSADVLTENNIVQYVSVPLQINGCVGCVFGYNFGVNPYYVQSATYLITTIMFHTAGDDLILVEGNTMPTMQGDVFHGSHTENTLFRNYIPGWAPKCYASGGGFGPCSNDLISIGLLSYNRNFNIIGNVLGQAGIGQAYSSPSSPAVYSLGTGNTEGSVTVPSDSVVTSSLMRWCNWDVVNNPASPGRCLAAEVPSAIGGPYQNAVPGSTVLPASFYLASKPPFFKSTDPYPLIGPDVTGGNVSGVSAHANTSPAQNCYISMGGPSDGVSSVLSFNAATCYTSSGGTPPAIPTGLTGSASGSTAVLSWSIPSGSPTGYNVLRATVSGGPYTTIATLISSNSYNDTNLAATTYYYVVQACNASGCSGNSSQVSVVIPPGVSVPAVPTNLTATAQGSSAVLNWTASTGTPTGYDVGRATFSGSCGAFSKVATLGLVTTYTNTGLANGSYCYSVDAFNSAGTSAGSTPATVVIATNSAATVAPSSLNFTPTNVGTAAVAQVVIITNTGTASLSSIVVNSPSGPAAADYAVTSDGCTGQTLAVNTNCNFTVNFTPSTTGTRQASVVITSNDPNSPDTVSLSGLGVSAVTVSPTSLNFGNVYTNKAAAAQTVTFTNNSGGTVTFSSIALTTGTQFSISGNTCGGSIVNGTTCTVSITFTPTSVGIKNDTLTFTFTGAAGSPLTVSLTGKANKHGVLKVGAAVAWPNHIRKPQTTRT